MIDGVRWDSKKEYRRWRTLWALKEAGRIRDLRRQVKFPIAVNGVHVCDYVADFTYQDAGRLVVEDVKSAFTRKLPVYRLKKKLVRVVYGIEIREV